VADERQGRSLAGRLLGWAKRSPEDGTEDVPVGPERSLPTKVFPRFLAALAHREAPALLDLGPVVGSNVAFFGERLGCKLFVEDLFADLDRFARDGRMGDLPAHFGTRLSQADGSVDGILCWDLFDYLDKPIALALGKQLARVLRPGGALAGFFTTVLSSEQAFTKYVVADERTLVHRPYRGSRGKGLVLVNRDIGLLFPGLRVAESFLLLNHTREVLFRKPDVPQRA
jgi:hypothetical protein